MFGYEIDLYFSLFVWINFMVIYNKNFTTGSRYEVTLSRMISVVIRVNMIYIVRNKMDLNVAVDCNNWLKIL